MEEFDALTPAGRRRRLFALAKLALSHYELHEPAIEFHAAVTNLHYRVTTRDGRRLMLRLGHPSWRTLDDLVSEAMWLEALARDTDVGAPEVIRTREGLPVFELRTDGVPEPRHVTLMTRVPGRILGRHLSEASIAKMGLLFAGLHIHGKSWMPPAGFTTKRFEHWLSRGEPNLLLDEANLARLPKDSREAVLMMNSLVERAYDRIDRADLRVIHCDLWHDNIKLHHGRLHPFDFEDTVNGFRSHDIAMAMLDLLEATGDERYAVLLAAFRRGYEHLLDWPEDPIEPFQIGRILWKLNYIARFHGRWFEKAVARHMGVLSTFERTGRVVRPPTD